MRGFRERPRSGVGLAVIAALLTLLLSRSRPEVSAEAVGLIAIVLVGLSLIVPSIIHEAHGRWQLRPVCWMQDGRWCLEINPRWNDRISCRCVVTDESGHSASHEWGQLGGRAAVKFPDHFKQVQSMKAVTLQPRGRYLVRWNVRQAGNTFEASSEFVWR